MKKLKKLMVVMLLILTSITPVFTACDFVNIYSSTQLKTPVVTMHEESKIITWKEISRAKEYDVYCNGTICEIITVDKDTDLMYDFTGELNIDGTYSFYVIAKSNSTIIDDSEASNIVSYVYKYTPIIQPDTPAGDIDTEYTIPVSINGVTLTYTKIEDSNIDNYILYLYSNSSGLVKYDLDTTQVNLNSMKYALKDEIYAIRIGYKLDDKEIISSDLIYYNPDKYAPYTDNIYMFDGYINDFYVEGLQELKTLVYYSFIYRLTEFNFKLSNEMYSTILEGFYGYTFQDKLNYAINYCFKQFYETIAYDGNNNGGFIKTLSASNKEYNFKITYFNVVECDITIEPMKSSILSQAVNDTYYELSDKQTREEEFGINYDNFVSDKQFLYTEVSTSEELYWAVENKITPVFSSTSCRAYEIYAKAKQVLNRILSNDMSDYEMALCIFEWICDNTNYDYTSYTTANGYLASVQGNPLTLPCFYLEGVFITGYAVCDGFSKAYSLMCNMMGIDAIRIVGDAVTPTGSGGHAWNKVLIDKDENDNISAQYYLVDITWTEIQSSGEEELSHYYFLLSDADCIDTHFQYKNREKFNSYTSSSNYGYYEYSTFIYKQATYDLVVKSKHELSAMFDYMLLNNREAMEVIIDFDFMIDCYEEENGEGSYDPSTDLAITNSGQLYYYYNLRSLFTEVLRNSKFKEQFLFITTSDTDVVYNNNGDTGMVYIFAQNLLIDEDGEVAHLIEYLDENEITGEFVLYIDNKILNTQSDSNNLTRAINLFENSINSATNIDVEFVLTGSNIVYSSTSTDKAATYTMKVTAA